MYRLAVFLGTAVAAAELGAALAASPVAAADTGTSPVDTWPYTGDVIGGDYGSGAGNEITYDTATGTPWYTAEVNNSVIPNVYADYHTDVTKVLDPSIGYPAVGTVADQTDSFYVPIDLEGQTQYIPYYTNYYISDPTLGTSDETNFGAYVSNLYVSDAAGIEDQVTFDGGQPITLFEFPAADAGSSDATDALPPLVTDLAG